MKEQLKTGNSGNRNSVLRGAHSLNLFSQELISRVFSREFAGAG
jgi:hypothetical protein